MSEPILVLDHVAKKFEDKTILEDINLTVSKGEVVVLLGPSGCGKSTLLRCMNGLEPIQGGSVTLEGQPVVYGDKSLAEIRQKIGMVFQSYDLFPHLNVIDNITLAPRKVQKRKRTDAEEEAMELLKRVGLSGRAKSYPRELSGGQKQCIAIVRSLIMHPDVMLFDEVTASLDPEMVREVLDVMLALAKQETTMVIVTHVIQFAKAIAHSGLFIDDKRIMEDLTPEQFFTAPTTERAKKFLKMFEFD